MLNFHKSYEVDSYLIGGATFNNYVIRANQKHQII